MLWNKLTICRLNCFLYFKQLTTLFAYAYLPVFWCYYKGGGRGFRIYAMWLTFLFNFTHWILGTSILQLVKNQTFFFFFKKYLFLIINLCVCVCMEARRGYQISWSWSYRLLALIHLTWLLGTELWTSIRATCALNCCAILQPPPPHALNTPVGCLSWCSLGMLGWPQTRRDPTASAL